MGWLAACAFACVAACGGGGGSPALDAATGTPQVPPPATSTGASCTAGNCTTPSPPAGSACTNPVAASAATAADGVQHVGAVRVGTSFTFDVPPNTVSITIVEQATSAPATIGYGASTFDNTAVPLRVTAPGGTVVYDDLVAYSSMTPDAVAQLGAFFDSAAPGTGALTLPNTTGGLALIGSDGLPIGTWTAIVSDHAYECTLPGFGVCSGASTTSTYDVTIVTKPGTGGAIPAQGAVDVAVYFATTEAGSGAPLSAAIANAGGDPDLNRMGQALRALFANASLAVSTLAYYDLPADVQALYASGVNADDAGACGELASLLRRSRQGNLLNVFLVSSFTSATQTTGQIVGVDGSIPGPATFGGTGASGAAVATIDLRAGSGSRACNGTAPNLLCGADRTAYIIAHEAGHFMGLYHVTEADGDRFDPLLDTPACPCVSCAPPGSTCATATTAPASPYQMLVTDCTPSSALPACGGGSNLMFWLLAQGSTGVLTSEQQRVLRANPLVH